MGGALVPANTPLYGTVRIEGQRMAVTVNSIESGGNILPVELTAYDMDGQAGLFVPNTAERTAMKEAAANIGAVSEQASRSHAVPRNNSSWT